MRSLSYRLYQKSLAAYVRDGDKGASWRQHYENAIQRAVGLLSILRHFRFPERKTGGWWWIWRWRFEVLMGWYELESEDWFKKLIKPGNTVFDIGGHLGVHSRRFSRLAGSRGKVFVFEANPENVDVLGYNLTGFRNVEVVPAAVADRDGTARLHLSPGHSNHSLNPGYTEETGTVEVKCLTIDEFCSGRGIPSVDFVKIDTEGAEPMVLRGMRKTIQTNAAITLLVEYNPAALKAGGVMPEQLLALLDDLGLRYECVNEDGSLGPIPTLSGNQYTNLLCVRA